MSRIKVRSEQDKLASLLKQLRLDAALRQIDVAKRLKQPQSFVSKYESGERSLTLIELRRVCKTINVPLLELVRKFEETIS